MRQVWVQVIKSVILVLVAIAGLVMLATCSSSSGSPAISASSLTPTEDDAAACSAEGIEATLLETHNLTREFDQVLFLAQNAPPAQLVSPLMKMQDIRHSAEQQELPDCMQVLKANRDNYMNATLIYMAHFMSGQEETIQAEMAAAAKYQADYKTELARLLQENNLAPVSQAPTASMQEAAAPQEPTAETPLAEQPAAPAEQAAVEVAATNDSDMIILLRAQPDLEAEIVGQLEPAQQVRVLGKSADNFWLQVEFSAAPDGLAWVDRLSVEVAGAEDALPVINGGS